MLWPHAGRKTKVLRLHRCYRPATASVHDCPAGVDALSWWPTAYHGAVHALAATTESLLRVRGSSRRQSGPCCGHTPGEKRWCCAYTDATGRPGRVYMTALPVWKLSFDGQQPTMARCTRSQPPPNLLRVRGSSRGGSRGRAVTTRRAKKDCLLYTSPSPRDRTRSRMPSSA